ncbi:TRAP transporter small permease [Burkholderiaceae bacterium]|nr:TRAP transporter small permease [Burkholderiaceae bacterium]
MADVLSPAARAQEPTEWYGRTLGATCKVFAFLSGITLVAMALMSLASIIGRSLFASAIIGDYELVEIASGMAVSLALPYTQWARSHVIVDFFTAKSSPNKVLVLDAIASALLAIVAFIFTWRITVGLLDLIGGWDASLMLNIPTWWGYAPMVPSFALLGLVALYTCVADIRRIKR